MSSNRHGINRYSFHKKIKRKALANCPQKKGICVRVFKISPKKPCSAKRSVTFVRLSNEYYIICKISGEGHNLKKYSSVLVRGGRTLDIPGCKYRIIFGSKNSDIRVMFPGKKKKARSKLGLKNIYIVRHLRLQKRFDSMKSGTKFSNFIPVQNKKIKYFEAFFPIIKSVRPKRTYPRTFKFHV